MPTPLFKTKTVKIDTLGEYLTGVREQLNFDIKTVGMLTQIKPEYLQHLEAGNFVRLPADVYVRGFLKNLAAFYHIKEKILIDQYEKERGFAPPSGSNTHPNGLKISLTPKNIIIGASLLVAILAIGYVGSQIRSVLAPPFLEIYEPGGDLTVRGSSMVVAGRGEVGAVILLNNQPVFMDSAGRFTENLILSPGLNVIQITERNKFGKTSEKTRQITAQIPDQKPAAAAVNLTVNIGPGNAWVYLEADGIVIERGTMLAGSTKNISAKNQIILTSANAGSTQVVYNGKDLGKLGREGEVVRNVEFSSQ